MNNVCFSGMETPWHWMAATALLSDVFSDLVLCVEGTQWQICCSTWITWVQTCTGWEMSSGISCFCDVWFEEDFRRRSSSHRQEGCVGAPMCSILEILNLSAVYNKVDKVSKNRVGRSRTLQRQPILKSELFCCCCGCRRANWKTRESIHLLFRGRATYHLGWTCFFHDIDDDDDEDDDACVFNNFNMPT